MKRHEHLLIILAEECAEVAQRATKALRFGLDEVQPGQERTNAQRIMGEMNDLFTVVEMLQRDGKLPATPGPAERVAKVEKIEWFLNYSRQLGTFTPDEPTEPLEQPTDATKGTGE